MAIISHAIMGDVAYEPKLFCVKTKELETRKICERMCLHALKLDLPLRGGERKSFITPDLFVYIKDSEDSKVSSVGRFLI